MRDKPNDTKRAAEPIGTKEAAKILGCSKDWIQKLCISGDLPAVLIGRVYVIKVKDVLNFERRPPGRPPNKKKRR